MLYIASLIAPLAFAAIPAPEPSEGPMLRLAGGLGAVLETRHFADDQAMLVLALTPTLHVGDVVVGFDLQHHTTDHNDTKLDVGGRVGGALDLPDAWDGTLTLDLGWRQQTRSRFDPTFIDWPTDHGIDQSFVYAGATLGLHHRRSREGGLVYGLELFARADLEPPYRVPDPDATYGSAIFAGTVEVGVTAKLGLDVLFGR